MVDMTQLKTLDPRQAKAIDYYTRPSSPTFSDLKNSMIKAGFGEKYADTIHTDKPKWLTDNLVTTVETISKAEKNLKETIDRGIDMKPETKIDMEMNKMTMGATQFALKTLAREKYDAENEKADTNVQINIVNYNDKKDDDDVVDAIDVEVE